MLLLLLMLWLSSFADHLPKRCIDTKLLIFHSSWRFSHCLETLKFIGQLKVTVKRVQFVIFLFRVRKDSVVIFFDGAEKAGILIIIYLLVSSCTRFIALTIVGNGRFVFFMTTRLQSTRLFSTVLRFSNHLPLLRSLSSIFFQDVFIAIVDSLLQICSWYTRSSLSYILDIRG